MVIIVTQNQRGQNCKTRNKKIRWNCTYKYIPIYCNILYHPAITYILGTCLVHSSLLTDWHCRPAKRPICGQVYMCDGRNMVLIRRSSTKGVSLFRVSYHFTQRELNFNIFCLTRDGFGRATLKRNEKMKGNERKWKKIGNMRKWVGGNKRKWKDMITIAMFWGYRSSGSPIALHNKVQILVSDGNLHRGPFIPSFDPFSYNYIYNYIRIACVCAKGGLCNSLAYNDPKRGRRMPSPSIMCIPMLPRLHSLCFHIFFL